MNAKHEDAVRVVCSALDVWRGKDAEEAAAVAWVDFFVEVEPHVVQTACVVPGAGDPLGAGRFRGRKQRLGVCQVF